MEKEYRVKKGKEIENILSNKKRIGNNNFTIYYKRNETGHFRLAISVSKKNGNAVMRNKEKRVIREIIRPLNLLDFDIFIIAKSSSMDLSFEQTQKDLHYLLKKGNLIGKKQ